MTRDTKLDDDKPPLQGSAAKKSRMSAGGEKSGVSVDSEWNRIVSDCIDSATDWKRLEAFEENGAIENVLWPVFFSSSLEDSVYKNTAFAVAKLVQRRCHISSSSFTGSRVSIGDGPFGFVYHTPNPNHSDISNTHAFQLLLIYLFQYLADQTHAAQTEVTVLSFLIAALQAMEPQSASAAKSVIGPAFQQLTSIGMWNYMSPHIREYHLRYNHGFRQRWNHFIHSDENNKNSQTNALHTYLPSLARRYSTVLQDMHFENSSQLQSNPFLSVFLHLTLQLFIDLLSIPSTRRYTKTFLLSIQFTVLSTCSDIYSQGKTRLHTNNNNLLETHVPTNQSHPDSILFAQLVQRLQDLETFGMDDITCAPFSTTQMQTIYHERASILQKMIHQHYMQELPDLVYASVAMICEGTSSSSSSSSSSVNRDVVLDPTTHTFLRKHLDTVVDWKKVLLDLAHRLRLLNQEDVLPWSVSKEDECRAREFVTQVLLYHHTLQPSEVQRLQSLPLFPDEILLWDPYRVPPGHISLLSRNNMSTLALPKLGTQFLTFGDYLARVFHLMRLESAYEIRMDIVDVLRRMKPTSSHHFSSDVKVHLRSKLISNNTSFLHAPEISEERLEQINRQKLLTEFHGWARMGIEISSSSPFRIVQVSPPRLGENIPSQVIGELCWDLSNCGDGLRKEWDEINELDTLFLLAVDATAMSAEPAPTIDDDVSTKFPDEEDVTFPRRFGLLAVRGCTVLEVRDDAGNVRNDCGREQGNENEDLKPYSKNHLRFVKVELDSAQYAADVSGRGSLFGAEVYSLLNVVVRRQSKENNFRSILHTIRGLMNGGGSINKSIPTWFRPVFLGYGDPSSVSYKSKQMTKYALKETGITETLDYGDTFLDESHIRESFPSHQVMIDDTSSPNKEAGYRTHFRVKITSTDGQIPSVIATPYTRSALYRGNSIRFTPVQVEAIRSGLSLGVSLIVGPPGTGKTDVAVQIISNLFHSFPTQRTVIVTHSNAALNDLFEKVMIRGDIDERYMIRLGSGERDLQLSSQFDFTRAGRVKHCLFRRLELLEKVQHLSESLGISGTMERGPDGSASYTCETAEYFRIHYIEKLKASFYENISSIDCSSHQIFTFFPFKRYYGIDDLHGSMSINDADSKIEKIKSIFDELTEYRPLELLRSHKQRSDYLITKQARIVAMTCTHAAIMRSHLVDIGFRYDNVVIEEAGQMRDIETFIPLLLQSTDGQSARLKRIVCIGDHHQLPPVVKNISLARFSRTDQSLFSRLISQGVPIIQLNKQGRARAEIAKLYSWRYDNLGDLDLITSDSKFQVANAGFAHTYQLIDCGNYMGRGETTPTAFFYQNIGEAEYAVAIFQYMVMIGYPPEKITLLTTYNGQKELILDILSHRCGSGTPLSKIRPHAVSTVDQYQGQQNDYVILSLVRTENVGHLRDIRRLIVATSRARLGLYVLCRQQLFSNCREIKHTIDFFNTLPSKLELVVGEHYPSERSTKELVDSHRLFSVENVFQMGQIVYDMQNDWCDQLIS